MATFVYETRVQPGWIDYNGHMRDSYYGMVFSLAVDALQDDVGFDAAYRGSTGCTIYLVEGHTRFLSEVKEGAALRVETHLLGCDAKRFHLYMTMHEGARLTAVGEFMELHVRQTPAPTATPMPEPIRARLAEACLSATAATALPFRARAMSL